MREQAAERTLVVGRHYPLIDGLRALAVLSVIWHHAASVARELVGLPETVFAKIYYALSSLGGSGVDLFFVISGFLITGILMDTAYETRCFRKFYIRRTLRIFPLYYVSLAVIFGSIGLWGRFPDPDFTFFSYFLYIQNWFMSFDLNSYMYLNHFWSLAIEEQFYLFWPVLFLFFYRKKPGMVWPFCAVLILCSFALRFFWVEAGQVNAAYTFTFSRLDGLLMGAMLAFGLRSGAVTEEALRRVSPVVALPGLLAAALLILIGGAGADHELFRVKYCVFLLSLVSVFVLGGILDGGKEGIWRSFLGLGPVRYIGRISYGLYIFHWPVMLVMAQFSPFKEYGYWINHVYLFFAGFAVCFFVAGLSYAYFEKPVLKLKDKYAPLEK